MTEWGKFEEKKFSRSDETDPKPAECAVCEAMCPDAVDGTLTEAERRVFERHVTGCAACAKEYEEAQRGAAWLGVLKGHTPEPPKTLLAKILAETTGAEAGNPVLRDESAQEWGAQDIGSSLPVAAPVREPAPAWALSSVLRKVVDVFRIETARAHFQPRLAMTAAMAFFSIALTLNLAGVRLKNLRASDFTPSGLRRNVADAGASVARNIQNMRVVYQVESRVSELRGEGPLAQREDTDFTPQSNGVTQQAQPQQQQQPAPRKKGL
ncbi:MAG TPA: zf-HC2 domain-containing protein [Acidobacteriaceae bacterium]